MSQKNHLKIKTLLVVILIIVFLAGCQGVNNAGNNTASESSDNTTETSDTATIEAENNSSGSDSQNNENETDATDNNQASETDATVNTDGMVINPLTGLYISEEVLNTRPLAVMLDNQYYARPQAGLINADVAYEILAEGLITRYMGIFFSDMPDHIGPIRSARPYFIEKALEFNPYYVHVGGSMQALSDIKTYQMADIDGLYSGAFHRESHKTIPHNMYSEADTLISFGKNRGYYTTVDVQFLNFNEIFTPLRNAKNANVIKFIYKAPTGSDRTGYFTTYEYDSNTMKYLRFTNGSPHVDEDTGEQLYATNILVQYVKTSVIDNEGRLKLGLVGSGKGMYYTGGMGIPVTWEKTDARATTVFYSESGDKIKLNPGKTWFQIMKTGSSESIEG